MHRCLLSVNDDIVIGKEYVLSKEESFHIFRILRLNCGDPVEVCDGRGTTYEGVLTDVGKTVTVKTLSICSENNEAQCDAAIFHSLSKGTKMDFIVQKATELGIKRIVPVITEFSVVSYKDESRKVERWNKIACEAVKQCKRSYVPQIDMPVKFHEAVNIMKNYDVSFIAYENEKKNKICDIFNSDRKVSSVAFMIGPEGGFSHNEIDFARSEDIKTVTLGKRILRTETAAVTLASIVMYKLNELE